MSGSRSGLAGLALVDDDFHSARLLVRMLVAHGAPSVDWMSDAEAAARQIADALEEDAPQHPGMVIVDLKGSSAATAAFLTRLRALPGGDALVLVAMAPSLDRATRDALLDAGAVAVFERHSDLAAYRKEAASIVSFWVRTQRLDAVGT